MSKVLSFLLACLVAAGPVGLTVADAAARAAAHGATRERTSADAEAYAAPDRPPRGQLEIVVSLAEQRAYVYRNGVEIAQSEASTGKEGHETPTGVFTILEKQRFHRSSRYNDAPMPYMQRLTWYGVALHGGPLPGYAASHGCIRLPLAFARKLFAMTSVGTTVVVTDGESEGGLGGARSSEPSESDEAPAEEPIPDDAPPDG